MNLLGYDVVEVSESGAYLVVKMSDGSTFGQIAHGAKTVSDADAIVNDAMLRLGLAQVKLPADASVLVPGYRDCTPPPPIPAEVQAALEGAVQAHLDARAMERGYSNILSAASYATSKSPKFGPEGVAYRDWRDAVWTYCYAQLAAVEAGARTIPSADALIAEIDAACPLTLP